MVFKQLKLKNGGLFLNIGCDVVNITGKYWELNVYISEVLNFEKLCLLLLVLLWFEILLLLAMLWFEILLLLAMLWFEILLLLAMLW